MWLIHAGFMSYETGIARKKNALATAMKNILTIAVVTPTFYYFGWWIYNCNQPGLPIGPNSSDFTAAACQGGIPWSDAFGPNLTNNINLVFFLAFLLFSWTTASIMSGAIIERARLTGVPRSSPASSARSSGSSTRPGDGAPAAGSRCASASTTRSRPASSTGWRARSRSGCSSSSGRE